jgi:predicted nucleic-acid-binding Zn-ribbon protein
MAEPGSKVTVLGKPLLCLVCGHDEFAQRAIKMQTTGMTFFDLDWLNKDADGAICTACGYVHQFAADAQVWD